MDRITGANTIDLGGGKRGFRGKDTVAGVPGTELTAAWHNEIQEEILKVIETAGILPSHADLTQLLQAIRFLSRGTIIPFAAPGSYSLVMPANVNRIRAWGRAGTGGGGGASTAANSVAAAGAGAAYFDGVFAVTPGSSLAILVGAAGIGGVGGASPGNGTAGGTTSIGTLASATGGAGGLAANGAVQTASALGGTATGAQFLVPGEVGGLGFSLGGGIFAHAPGGGGFGSSNNFVQVAGALNAGRAGLGCGGNGGILGGAGGNGAPGFLFVQY